MREPVSYASMRTHLFLLGALTAVAWGAATPAATPAAALRFENAQLVVQLHPRTPGQITAFYEGRGFPKAMVNRLSQQCFITVGIRNKSDGIIWHDLNGWRFITADGALRREDRAYWRAQWQQMQVPLAYQSTFRWTQLPEQLDFRPGEGEGGNIILPRTNQPFSVHARFLTGADKHGTPIEVRFDNVRCAEDAQP